MRGLPNDDPKRYDPLYWCPGDQLKWGWYTLDDINEFVRVGNVLRNW